MLNPEVINKYLTKPRVPLIALLLLLAACSQSPRAPAPPPVVNRALKGDAELREQGYAALREQGAKRAKAASPARNFRRNVRRGKQRKG